MTNDLSFGQRIAASWRMLVEHMNKALRIGEEQSVAEQRARYMNSLLMLGRQALQSERRDTFARAGCLGTIAACIEAGVTTRDDIVTTVVQHHNATYRQIGFLLGEYAGTDPEQHFWVRNNSGHYEPLSA